MAVNVRSVAYGELPDGRAVAYALSNGSVATFNVIDHLNRGEDLRCGAGAGGVGGSRRFCADGTMVFTARNPLPGGLFTFDTHTFEVTLHAGGPGRAVGPV